MSKVTVYSTDWCPWCTRVKDFLKENNIEFEDVNVQNDPARAQEMLAKSGQMGVPVVDIGGKIIVGFNEPEIWKALGL